MIFTSVKQSDDVMIEKLNASKPSLKMTTRQPLLTMSTETTGHNIKWDHFEILGSFKTDYGSKGSPTESAFESQSEGLKSQGLASCDAIFFKP